MRGLEPAWRTLPKAFPAPWKREAIFGLRTTAWLLQRKPICLCIGHWCHTILQSHNHLEAFLGTLHCLQCKEFQVPFLIRLMFPAFLAFMHTWHRSSRPMRSDFEGSEAVWSSIWLEKCWLLNCRYPSFLSELHIYIRHWSIICFHIVVCVDDWFEAKNGVPWKMTLMCQNVTPWTPIWNHFMNKTRWCCITSA